jgi:transcriptional regulator GlxA family with amidase domain
LYRKKHIGEKIMKKFLVLLFVVVFASLSLVSCFFPNADKAAEKLEDEDYEVETIKSKEAAAMLEMLDIDVEVDEALAAMNEDGEFVYIFYCASSSDAKDLQADLEKVLEDEEYEDMMGEIDGVERSGKAVYFGTKKAMKILK